MKQNPLIERLLKEDGVRDLDYPALAKALPDADYTFQPAENKGRGRTWTHPSGDVLTIRDRGAGTPLWPDEIDKVAGRLRTLQRQGGTNADERAAEKTGG